MNILIGTLKFILLLISCLNINGHTIKKNFHEFDQTCGYEGCPAAPGNKLNIHLVPHSHDDVGWLKTVDQYYYGSESLIQKAGVQYILDSVIHELLANRNRRFIWVESAFFFKWYNEQSPEMKDKVKSLVNEGRLEFIGGAWSMNDEGTTHYQSIIDQFAWGLRHLEQTFGNCSRPRIGWQIDPFGHSKEMASIFAQMGYDGLFFARLDWKDKNYRLKNKIGEMVWQSSNSLGKSSDLFTGILANHYSAPPGFCFDFLCSDEPIMDGNDMMERNVEERLNQFYDYIKNMTKLYATNNLMVPMGDDFNYQDANMWYKNLDKIIKYSKGRKVNDQEVNIFYSTPSCYLKSLHDSGKTWPTESNDFFPYSTDPYTYWSGYFTSRPNLKYYERLSNNYFQIIKKMIATYNLVVNPIIESHLTLLREAMGIMQHHDAITGTEKQKVSDDYGRILAEAIEKTTVIKRLILNEWLLDETQPERFEMESCFKLNTTECNITESFDTFMITLYNPLTYPVDHYVRVPVREGYFEVKNSKGELIPAQLIKIPERVQIIPGRSSHASQELIFKAEVEAVNSYYISKTSSNEIIKEYPETKKEKENNIIIKNSRVELTFTDGLLTAVKSNGTQIKLKQEMLFYEGAVGNNAEFKNRSSGAYIFLPKGSAQSFQSDSNKIEIKVTEGNLVKEVQQIYNDWVSQIIRIYETEDIVEFEWLVGPLPTIDKIGYEIISRFESEDINSGNVFYTDSNGREMVKRIFNASLEESPIGGNYYPVTARIAIEQEEMGNNLRMAVLNDRAQGGSSLKSGQIELMVHRRLFHDDAFGVGEALNESAYGKGIVARGKHRLVIGKNLEKVQTEERNLQQKMLLQPWLFFSTLNDMTFDAWKTELNHNIKHLHEKDNIPEEVNILSLEPWTSKKILLRFENILDKSEGGKNVKFNIKNLFKNLFGKSIRETTLDGNKWLNETIRMEFKTKNNLRDKTNDGVSTKPLYYQTEDDISNLEIELNPMQIRTFILQQV